MRTLVNKKIFEEWLEAQIGKYMVKEVNEVLIYKIVDAHNIQFQNNIFSILDSEMEGIKIQFYNFSLKKMQVIHHIYHWNDAYRLLQIGLISPELLKYKDENKGEVFISKTLNIMPYSFMWNPDRKLDDFGEEQLRSALQLIKYGFIDCLEEDEEKDFICTHSKINACEENAGWQQLEKQVKELFENGFFEREDNSAHLRQDNHSMLYAICGEQQCPNECKCILALCGYLEYMSRNEDIVELLREWKQKWKEYHIACEPYQFAWKPKDGLRLLDEAHYNIVQEIVDKNLVQVGYKLDSENYIQINWAEIINDIQESDSQEEFNTCYWADLLETCNKIENNFFPGLRIKPDETLYQQPTGVFQDSYLIYYAGYLSYLLGTGQLETITADREWFAQHKKESEQAMKKEFSYKISDQYLDASMELLEIAELLQEKNYVSMYPDIVENDGNSFYYLRTVKAIVDFEGNYADLKEAINTNKIVRDEPYYYNVYSFSNCEEKKHIIMAGYIDYLKNTAQYENYETKLTERWKSTGESFERIKKEIPMLGKVIHIAESEKESGLYCVIEGERGVGKQDIVKQIVKLLAHKGKIDNIDYECHTFEEMENILGYQAAYDLDLSTKSSQFMHYSCFEKKKLYVLTDLKEFIYECKSATDGDGSAAAHLVKLLGRYQPQTYIIIIGDKKYVDQFIELSPQIKFLFGNNIIPIKSYTAERLFSLYSERLSDSLQFELLFQPEFEKKFLDFIALNGKLLPLGNSELANYLADYANARDELVLPPDIYRKQTAKEMLDSIVGMSNVKKTAYEFERYALYSKHAEMMNMKLPNNNMHMIFTGNPGTGKTMIARIIGQMLFDLGIIGENKVVEVEAKDLKAQYIGESAIKTGRVIDQVMGGVLFIDEAYAIGQDAFGKDVIATLIKAMEDHKDKFVVIFAGYEKEMQEFLNINSGIASRIGYTFHFEDYSVDELTDMFDRKMKKAGFIYEDFVLTKVKEICDHFSGKRNFGNGRFVDKIVQRVILKHASKDNSLDVINRIDLDDFPTIEELVSTDVVENKDFELQLAQFVGLESVKDKVRQLAKYMEFQQRAKEAGAKIPAGNMHMVFTGNPGTGKTTIARIMVDMLFSIGVIKENKLIEAERKDLVAEYIGQTAVKTSEVIERALDGVLFVDEAYTLAPENAGNDFGKEAIATLIKAMEDHKSDLIVIFAGYKDEMRQFVNSNPGVASRIGNTFHFEDYKLDELLVMFENRMNQAGFTMSENARKKVAILLEYFSRKKNFGNGRFIAKLQQETLICHSKNLVEDSKLLVIEVEDIPEISSLNNTPPKIEKSKELDTIIGMSEVKQKMKEFEALVNFEMIAREHGLTVPDSNMHMLFVGNPGTGKTTIARIIASKLYNIGVIKDNKLVEVDRKDLVAGYIGQTAGKTMDVIEKALGGILFIDEAYTLTPKSEADLSGESIATLIKAMEDHKGDLVVIFAGYKKEMSDFVESNPGIASRIGFTFQFEDYSGTELVEIFAKKLEHNGFRITEAARVKANEIMTHFAGRRNFGNGRFVDRIIQNTLSIHARNYSIDQIEVIDAGDIPAIRDIDTMISFS